MLKRILGIVLAATLVFSTAVVAFAAYNYGETFSGVVSSSANGIPNDLDVGSTTDILLIRKDINGNQVGDPGVANQSKVGKVDSSFMNRYRVTTSVSEGKSYLTASLVKKSSQYYLRLETKPSTSKLDREVTVRITSRENGGDRRSETTEFNFTIIADANQVKDSISSYDDEYELDEGVRTSVECDTNISKCRINIGPSTYAEVKARQGDILTFHLEYDDEDDEVSYNAPDDSSLIFYNFKASPTFRQSTKVGLYADDGQKYVYSIGANSKLTNIPATLREDYLTFNTTKLGYYVISDRKLSATGSTSSAASSSSSSESYYEEETTSSGGSSVDLSTLKQAFAKVAAGSTAVLTIDNDAVVKLADLKAAAVSYPRRGICIVHRVNGKVTYQYTFSAAQIATLKDSNSDGDLNLGMSSTATSTLAVFNTYYKNTFLSLEHLNKGSFGANASYAVHIGGTNISRNNLKIYWYDRSRNYYELVKTTPTVDKNSYLYFTAPVGHDIIVSDGTLIKR